MIEDIFTENKGRYGSRRIQLDLEQKNIKANLKRISRIMSEHGLIAIGLPSFSNLATPVRASYV